MTRYEQGFLTKCAEHGVDGRALLEKLAGPRPEERKAIQKMTANPATLKALTTPEAAPPRMDDPTLPLNMRGVYNAFSYGPSRMRNRDMSEEQRNLDADNILQGKPVNSLPRWNYAQVAERPARKEFWDNVFTNPDFHSYVRSRYPVIMPRPR